MVTCRRVALSAVFSYLLLSIASLSAPVRADEMFLNVDNESGLPIRSVPDISD